MKKITVKFQGICTETKKTLNIGELAFYEPSTKKMYCLTSEWAQKKEREHTETRSENDYNKGK